MTEGNEGRFIERRKDDIVPSLNKEQADALASGQPLTHEQSQAVLEAFETKVFTWEAQDRRAESKRVLLEASEPAAYKTLKPLIERLERDEQCRGITLLTDNVSGKRFSEEREHFQFKQVRSNAEPVMADIPDSHDIVLILGEPKDTPEKMLLYSGKSVFGAAGAKQYLYLDGLMGGTTRTLFSEANATHMDQIDAVLVANEFAKELLQGAVPSLGDKITVVGSILLESLRDTLPTPDREKQTRSELRQKLDIPDNAIAVLYAGFPSKDYAALGARAIPGASPEENTLNQETFMRTAAAMQDAALTHLERQFALVVRTHPRAAGKDNELEIPGDLPLNLRVVFANGPEYNHDDMVNAVADIIACQSTSTETFLAPYRGRAAAVFGYGGQGMQAEIDEKIFGHGGAEALARTGAVFYVRSEKSFAEYLGRYRGNSERMALPPDPIPAIAETLFPG